MDLSRAEERQAHPAVMEQLRKGGMTLPAVFVDDQPVSLGYVDYFSVAKAIEKTRSAGAARA